MVENLLLAIEHRAHVRLADGHADCVSKSLAERSRRRLDTGRVPVLRMPRRLAFPLPELLEVVEGQLVAGEIQHAVEKHRRVSGRQHEAIAVQPVWIGRVVTEVLGPEHVSEWRQRHRGAGVAGVCFLNCVHREDPDGVDAQVLQ